MTPPQKPASVNRISRPASEHASRHASQGTRPRRASVHRQHLRRAARAPCAPRLAGELPLHRRALARATHAGTLRGARRKARCSSAFWSCKARRTTAILTSSSCPHSKLSPAANVSSSLRPRDLTAAPPTRLRPPNVPKTTAPRSSLPYAPAPYKTPARRRARGTTR
jgi:hypothetical protein